MRVIYNGLDLFVLETYLFDTESVYDDTGTDYLYTKISVAVRAVVNGQVQTVQAVVPNGVPGPFMSYTWGPLDEANLFANPIGTARPSPRTVPPTNIFGANIVAGFSGTIPEATGVDFVTQSKLRKVFLSPNAPPMTHNVVRHRLSAPRGKLYVFSGPGMESGNPKPGQFLQPGGGAAKKGGEQVIPGPGMEFQDLICVESPQTALECDCKNGPLPKLLSVYAVQGDGNLFLVDWSCETYINEGPDNNVDTTGALLSNRFSQTQTVDKDGFTTIATDGTAIFRTDRIYDQTGNFSPDTQRPLLFMPILLGFVRENVVVTGLPDVTGVTYSYSDRQVASSFPAGPYARASSISAVHDQQIASRSDLAGAAANIYSELVSLRAQERFAKSPGEVEKPLVEAIQKLRKTIRNAARSRGGSAGGTGAGGASP